jgi:dolichol kinase
MKWPKTRKTVEGTLASLISTFVTLIGIWVYLNYLGFESGSNFSNLILLGIATLFGSLLESFTLQSDNLFVPLYYFAMITACAV